MIVGLVGVAIRSPRVQVKVGGIISVIQPSSRHVGMCESYPATSGSAKPWAETPKVGKVSPISQPVAIAVQPEFLLFRGRPEWKRRCFARSYHV